MRVSDSPRFPSIRSRCCIQMGRAELYGAYSGLGRSPVQRAPVKRREEGEAGRPKLSDEVEVLIADLLVAGDGRSGEWNVLLHLRKVLTIMTGAWEGCRGRAAMHARIS